MLKRQGRTARARRHAENASQFASCSNALNIIVEEDESSSRSASPLPLRAESSLKAKRRHANVSDIRIARNMPVHDQSDLEAALLTSPRPAPSPPSTASPSPDSFELTFQFPHPPTATSPTSILGYYACESPSSDGMPLTPSTSDDEHARPVQAINPRRISIHPLVINKHSQRIFSEIEQQKEDTYDSDAESDSEWYTREFSKIISLRSPVPASFPQQNTAARRDSLFVDADDTLKASRRESKALPPTPSPRNSRVFIPSYPPPPVPASASARSTESPVPSFSSDPSSTNSQNAIRRPPPRFSVPADFEFTLEGQDDADAEDDDDTSSAFSFSMYDIDLGDADFTRPALADLEQSPSPRSSYSQPSFKGSEELDIRVGRIIGPGIPEEDEEEDAFSDQDVAFEMDYCMMLPLSLPSTPMDLEADIEKGLEQLRSSDNEEEPQFVHEDKEAMDTTTIEEEQPAQPQSPPQVASVRSDYIDDVFSPISPCFSPPPSSLTSSFIPYYSVASPVTDSYFPTSPNAAQTHTTNGMDTEERVLKSKWSSSTLGSIREEHERRGASSKLRLYFGGGNKRSSGTTRNSKVPATPTSPFPSFMSPRKASKTAPSPMSTASPLSPRNSAFPSPSNSQSSTPSPKSSPSPPHAAYTRAHPYSPSPKAHPTRAQHGHQRGSSRSSDVLVIGYGNNGVGVRRRGSVSTISSDAGTEISSSSTSSSGLRRKPIPVEMFLRSAA
ncbi:hypothetical protein D9619_010970 [Psilocybe cf. subviscida]|uniref:Uncharacterized protein n=1 Tax=Psilocybe cf. subviscida TaxID=2480587 RepID=A0A8H5B8A6_9AGAR|nr:hypothetical protein D9619_010970 [Psilocybe cf. subviscida]